MRRRGLLSLIFGAPAAVAAAKVIPPTPVTAPQILAELSTETVEEVLSNTPFAVPNRMTRIMVSAAFADPGKSTYHFRVGEIPYSEDPGIETEIDEPSGFAEEADYDPDDEED